MDNDTQRDGVRVFLTIDAQCPPITRGLIIEKGAFTHSHQN